MPRAILSLFTLAVIAMLTTQACQAQVVIDTTFGKGQPVSTPAPDRVTGTLPAGWGDNSSWARVWVDYRDGEDQAQAYTRVATSKVEEGWTQLQHALPSIANETFVRIELTARSLDDRMMRLGIRDVGKPYTWHWQTDLNLRSDWKAFRYEFRQGKIDSPIGLYLMSEGTGSFDLAAVKVTCFSREQLIAELKERAEATGTSNLLRLSRFPLGMQMGWSLNRDHSDGDQVVMEGDRECIGPSGSPALHVWGRDGVNFYTTPFGIPYAFGKHFASVSLKGSGHVSIHVICDGRTLASHRVSLTDKWQRGNIPFQPRLLADCYTLRVESSEECDFHLDAMQVAPAEADTGNAMEFAAQMPYEVALQVPESNASAARIQFDDEPAALEYCVTATAPVADAVLCAKVINAYGQSRDLPGEAVRGRIVYGRFADFMKDFDQRFGPHRVEAWIEDSSGKRISTYNEMLVYRLPRPKYWGKDAPHSAFGVHTNSTTRHCVMLKAIGANWTRLHDAGLDYIGWYHLEPEKGRWQFHDEPIERYRKHHVMILGELARLRPGHPITRATT